MAIDNLKQRQEAGEQVEKRLLDMLLGYTPCSDLKVADVKQIASFARAISFAEFSAIENPPARLPR